MKPKYENILLIAGNGQNVGKTTFACSVLKNIRIQKPIAVKITPHFHKTTSGLIEIKEGRNWKLFEETDKTTTKDSSLYLQNGAQKSYLIQTIDKGLPGAFATLEKFLFKNQPVIIESAALIEIIDPGLFVLIYSEKNPGNKDVIDRLNVANIVVKSANNKFFPEPTQFSYKETWILDT